MILRHLLSILLLPFIVVVGVPYWLLTSYAVTDTRWEALSPLAWLPRSLGMVLLICGLALFGWCVSLFARVGQGTLAPWDPTQALVAIGPYRAVRNPMISGVALMLAGQALWWGSRGIGILAESGPDRVEIVDYQ
jgi:protein-S-isoprenylcysteine O-methyltransferase Ste14